MVEKWDRENIERYDDLFLLENYDDENDACSRQGASINHKEIHSHNIFAMFDEILKRLEFYDKYKDKV